VLRPKQLDRFSNTASRIFILVQGDNQMNAVNMTGPFRPLFGPFCTDILAEQATNTTIQKKEPPVLLCPKARYKVAYKQVAEKAPAEQNPRLEMAQSQSSGDGESDLDNKAAAAVSSPAVSESGGEKEPQNSMEGIAQGQLEGGTGVVEKAQAEMSLVMGFSDSLSGLLRGHFQEQASAGGEAIKPIAQSADSMQALLAGLNESLPAFPAGANVGAADTLATPSWQQNVDTSDVVAIDFTTAFTQQNSQSDSMPTFRDFFRQQNSTPAVNQPSGVADHRFFQPPAQKLKPVPRRAAAERPVAEVCVINCAEKRKAEWEDPPTAEAPEESEDMETDAERGIQDAGSDKACEEKKSPRCLTRTEEQRMKDRAKAKRHRQRKKVSLCESTSFFPYDSCASAMNSHCERRSFAARNETL
jgi:hypothetical protein